MFLEVLERLKKEGMSVPLTDRVLNLRGESGVSQGGGISQMSGMPGVEIDKWCDRFPSAVLTDSVGVVGSIQ